MSLIRALSNRVPIVWVNTLEPERVISTLPELKSDPRDLYLFDSFNGLMQWNADAKDWKITLVEMQNPDTGELEDIPIVLQQQAFYYVLTLEESAVLIVRNAHKSIDDFLTLYSELYGRYRQTFFTDDLEKLPTQIVALAGMDPPPLEIAQMSSTVNWGLPTASDFRVIISNIAEYYGSHVIDEKGIEPLIQYSVGMGEEAAIESYLSCIRTTNKIDGATLRGLRLERLKAMSNLEVDEPKFTIDQVGGLDNAKKLIQRAAWVWQNPEAAAEHGLEPLRRVLLLGLSGCGKSMLCEAAANALGLQLAKASIAQAMNKFIGESEKNITLIFDQINAMAPIAVWMDELGRDLSGGDSSNYTDGGTTSRVHGTFLTKLQELNKDVFLFAAANNIESLAPEMLREDRFDKIFFVGFPSEEERREIFPLYLPADGEFDLDELASRTACFTGAEIKGLIKRTKDDIIPFYNRGITTKDVVAAIPNQKNRIWIRHRQLAVSMYIQAHETYEWASSSQFNDAQEIMRGREPSAVKHRIVPAGQVILK